VVYLTVHSHGIYRLIGLDEIIAKRQAGIKIVIPSRPFFFSKEQPSVWQLLIVEKGNAAEWVFFVVVDDENKK
jgi:hypothetical protein